MHLQCFAEIYIDIGTNILYFQCFVTTDMFLFCKPIFISGICCIFRDIAFGSAKTRFKAILRKQEFSAQVDFSAQFYFFHELLPPEGDFSAHIYFFHDFLPPEGDFSAQIYLFDNCLPRRATSLPKFTFLMNVCPRRATFLPNFTF